MVNALLVYPKNPITFWSFDEALKIAGKKVVFQPAGLLTIAGMLPEDKYSVKIVDENVKRLENKDLEWADVVLTSSMIIHWNSLEEIIKRANEFEKPVLSGGPLSTQYHNEIKGNATFFLGEAESGFLDALEDIVKDGYKPESKIVDRRKQFLSMDNVSLQRFDLIKDSLKDYAAMAIQTTRGCPESCTFCNIPSLYGKKTRLKESNKVISELQLLYDLGWRAPIMIVDDNIVGNQEKIIPILKDVAKWQNKHGYPYKFFTQASLRMYENEELMEAMYQAGFNQVFFGLESPSQESLKFMGAQKNLHAKNERGRKSMLEKIIDIQENYFKVQAGFIIGFETDPDNIADLMKDFIQDARIGVAMVGPLGVLPDTPDYERYKREGRLNEGIRYGGDSGILSRKLSYIPVDKEGNEIDPNIILDRYKDILSHINSPEAYFERTLEYLRHRKRKPLVRMAIDGNNILAFLRSVYNQGIKSNYKVDYWRFLKDATMNDITDFPDAISYAAHGHHLITTTQESIKADNINTALERLFGKMDNIGDALRKKGSIYTQDIVEMYKGIKHEFKQFVNERYRLFLDNPTSDY